MLHYASAILLFFSILLSSCSSTPVQEIQKNLPVNSKTSSDVSESERNEINNLISPWIKDQMTSSLWEVSDFDYGKMPEALKPFKKMTLKFVTALPAKEIKCRTWSSDQTVTCDVESPVEVQIQDSKIVFDLSIGIVKKSNKKFTLDLSVDTTKALTDASLKKKRKSYSYVINLKGKTNNIFEDKNLKITFPFEKNFTGIPFSIENKMDSEIRINWNESTYVDTLGNSHSVTHNGVKFIEAKNKKEDTLIPARAKTVDLVVPTSNISFTQSWYVNPLLPILSASGNTLIDSQLNMGDGLKFKGKTFSLWLAFGVKGKLEKKEFKFQVKDVSEE